MEAEKRGYLNRLSDSELHEFIEEALSVVNGRRDRAGNAAALKDQETYGNTFTRDQAQVGQGADLGKIAYDRETGRHEITLDNIEQVMTYQAWGASQRQVGELVGEALLAAAKAILRSVPRCPSRTIALNHIVDARMRANAAITHERW